MELTLSRDQRINVSNSDQLSKLEKRKQFRLLDFMSKEMISPYKAIGIMYLRGVKEFWKYKQWLLSLWVTAFTSFAIHIVLARLINQGKLIEGGVHTQVEAYLVIGIATNFVVSNAIYFTSSQLRYQQQSGTLLYIQMTRVSPLFFVLVEFLWSMTLSLVIGILAVSPVLLFLGPLTIGTNRGTILGLSLLCLAVALIGVVYLNVSLTLRYQNAETFNWLISMVIAIVSGLYYPLTVLAQKSTVLIILALWLPFYQILAISREIFIPGYLDLSYNLTVGIIQPFPWVPLVSSLTWLALGALMLRRTWKWALREGALDRY